jgi:adenylate kinase
MRIGVVTGIPGVGKTTVLSAASEILKSRNTPFSIVNYGSYMLNLALSMKYVEDRDSIRKLPLSKQRDLQFEAARRIVEDASNLGEKGVVLVDTHAVIRTPNGYLPGLPKHVVEILSPYVIFLIESTPENILSRQRNDTARARQDYADLEVIREAIWFARMAAMSSAVLSGSAVKIVENVEGDPSTAAKVVVDIMMGT